MEFLREIGTHGACLWSEFDIPLSRGYFYEFHWTLDAGPHLAPEGAKQQEGRTGVRQPARRHGISLCQVPGREGRSPRSGVVGVGNQALGVGLDSHPGPRRGDLRREEAAGTGGINADGHGRWVRGVVGARPRHPRRRGDCLLPFRQGDFPVAYRPPTRR